jgi:hypothetical protein
MLSGRSPVSMSNKIIPKPLRGEGMPHIMNHSS